jgi:hypothetical protein
LNQHFDGKSWTKVTDEINARSTIPRLWSSMYSFHMSLAIVFSLRYVLNYHF